MIFLRSWLEWLQSFNELKTVYRYRALWMVVAALAVSGCSVNRIVIGRAADALAEGGLGFA